MPYSFNTFDQTVVDLFHELQPKNMLDIGCGAGKYGKIAQQIIPNTKRIGIEVEEKYIEKFELRSLYDEMRVGYASEVLNKDVNETFDLVVIGDCIEHMPKSVGIDLINYLTYRTKYILILAPEFIIQHEVEGVKEEAHISVWSEQDFLFHDNWAWDNCWQMGFYLLRGYQEADKSLSQVVDILNNKNIPITNGRNHDIERSLNLTKMLHPSRNDTTKEGHRVIFRHP